MLTLLSTLISFLMGGLPKLLDFFQDRSDKLHELALARMQIERELELRKAGFEAQERIEHIRTEQLATESAATTEQIFRLNNTTFEVFVTGLSLTFTRLVREYQNGMHDNWIWRSQWINEQFSKFRDIANDAEHITLGAREL